MCAYTLIDTYVLVEILKISAFAEYSLFTIYSYDYAFLLDISIIFGKNIKANKGIVDEINKILSTFLKSYCAVIL